MLEVLNEFLFHLCHFIRTMCCGHISETNLKSGIDRLWRLHLGPRPAFSITDALVLASAPFVQDMVSPTLYVGVGHPSSLQ